MTTINALVERAKLEFSHHDYKTLTPTFFVASYLNWPQAKVLALGSQQVNVVMTNYLRDLAQLTQGKPLHHIVPTFKFEDVELYVNENVLIPRDETLELVKLVENRLINSVKVLDLCAGSGIIGIKLAKANPTVKVDFVELDTKALTILQKNIVKNNLKNTKIIESNMFDKVKAKYNFIVSNPPYIARSDPKVHASVRNYEPQIALYAPENGLFFIKEILANYRRYCAESHFLAMEFGVDQQESIMKLLLELRIANFEFRKDINGKSRFLIIDNLVVNHDD